MVVAAQVLHVRHQLAWRSFFLAVVTPKCCEKRVNDAPCPLRCGWHALVEVFARGPPSGKALGNDSVTRGQLSR